MNRLQKFIEQGAYGKKSGRIAYAFNFGSLNPARGWTGKSPSRSVLLTNF